VERKAPCSAVAIQHIHVINVNDLFVHLAGNASVLSSLQHMTHHLCVCFSQTAKVLPQWWCQV